MNEVVAVICSFAVVGLLFEAYLLYKEIKSEHKQDYTDR